MQDYWAGHFNDAATAFPDDPLKQVGKTVNGRSVEFKQVELWADCVEQALQLSGHDSVIDLCCGNGILTRQVARRCARIVGIDFAENLIRFADAHHAAPNTEYRVGDVTALDPGTFNDVTKVYMYESVQHLAPVAVSSLLRLMQASGSVQAFFVGGIPDRARYEAFYDTDEKRAYAKSREESGQPHIGTWWDKEEFARTVSAAGLVPHLIAQRSELYCSHFRFDCLITRPV